MNPTRTLFSPFLSNRSLVIALCLAFFAVNAFATDEEVIYRFKGGSDGHYPTGSLLADKAGNLYGTTVEGGNRKLCGENYPIGCGTVFELTPPTQPGGAWLETVLYRFQEGSDGHFPNGNLVADKDGNLYGTTGGGGVADNGTVFELERPSSPNGTWTYQVLYDFQGVPGGGGEGDGTFPMSVVFDAAGNLYGTTVGGGYCTNYQGFITCYGTVFKLQSPAQPGDPWTETVLHRFNSSGLSQPQASVVLDEKGNLYGTTYLGGLGGGGVYELTPPSMSGEGWIETTLFSFDFISSFPYFPEGAAPDASLTLDREGNLYGTTLIGGSANAGTVFELSPPTSGGSWTETVLHSFLNSGDGNSPLANLIFDTAGNLYSTTWMGGDSNEGTVFLLSPPGSLGGEWEETILHNFGSGSDGQQPTGGLIYGLGGALYGTTSQGGSTKDSTTCLEDDYAWTCGAVFRIAP
jgi:uncharacterized repeat protein (TIGR03803 family)